VCRIEQPGRTRIVVEKKEGKRVVRAENSDITSLEWLKRGKAHTEKKNRK
jgi:hypothetical protein